ncbi:hypothetical protein Pmani_031822 [Petrolisthes manimaculis]|uniref:Uncharacterized protein n=1 Tax=Petrolisthes manimaculis TaxID=1843537 RepID=A0AAE1NSW9_9EUCA|nr:hypothetical protein Pmani_031822 [Petrolisthes manimaculis]
MDGEGELGWTVRESWDGVMASDGEEGRMVRRKVKYKDLASKARPVRDGQKDGTCAAKRKLVSGVVVVCDLLLPSLVHFASSLVLLLYTCGGFPGLLLLPASAPAPCLRPCSLLPAPAPCSLLPASAPAPWSRKNGERDVEEGWTTLTIGAVEFDAVCSPLPCLQSSSVVKFVHGRVCTLQV